MTDQAQLSPLRLSTSQAQQEEYKSRFRSFKVKTGLTNVQKHTVALSTKNRKQVTADLFPPTMLSHALFSCFLRTVPSIYFLYYDYLILIVLYALIVACLLISFFFNCFYCLLQYSAFECLLKCCINKMHYS